jgi:hypothetical protein
MNSGNFVTRWVSMRQPNMVTIDGGGYIMRASPLVMNNLRILDSSRKLVVAVPRGVDDPGHSGKELIAQAHTSYIFGRWTLA